MLTEKNIIVPIYRYALKIVVFDNFSEVADRYPEIEDTGCKGTLIDYGDKSMMCIPPHDVYSVIHECEHAKNAIWKRVGFIPTPENDEPDAYLIEYLYKEAMKIVKKHLASQC